MDDFNDIPGNVVDIRSKFIAEQYRKYDLAIYGDSKELLRLLAELTGQYKLENEVQWITFFFGLFVTESIVRAVRDSGYKETLQLMSFYSGVNSALEQVETEFCKREEPLEIEKSKPSFFSLSSLSKLRESPLAQTQSASGNVIDFFSKTIEGREKKYDELMGSMYGDSREALGIVSSLVNEYAPEEGDAWITYYFGWIVTQDLVRTIKEEGYEEFLPIKSFSLGVYEGLDEIITEAHRRFDKAPEKTEVNLQPTVWYQILEDQTSEASESVDYGCKMHGEIGFFGLECWWLTELRESERNEIERVYKAHSACGELTSMRIASIRGVLASSVGFLTKLASLFPNASDFQISKKILDQAEGAICDDIHVLARDAFYREKTRHYYKQRSRHHAALEIAVESCVQQIEIACEAASAYREISGTSELPWHHGFRQLAIIREKERDFEAAIALSERAKEQGWGGDWEKRIARCRKKLTN